MNSWRYTNMFIVLLLLLLLCVAVLSDAGMYRGHSVQALLTLMLHVLS